MIAPRYPLMLVQVFKSNPRGWSIVALCFASLCTVYAVRSSLGLLMPWWEDDPGWSRAFASGAGSIVLILMAVSSPMAGLLLDRFGPRLVATGGLIAVGVGVLLTARASERWELIVLYGLMVGLGSGAVALPMVTSAVARNFTTHQGIAIGIGFSGATGGQFLALPTVAMLVVALGWRNTFVLIGAIALTLAWLTYAVFREPGPAGGSSHTPAAPLEALRLRLGALFHSPTFLLLLGGFAICGFTTAGVIEVHFQPYAVSCGFLPTEGATAYGVHGLFNMLGVIVIGFMTDRMHRPRLLGAIYLLRAGLFIVLLYVAGSLPLLFVFAALFGFLNFATVPVIASIVATHIGMRTMGLAMGLIFAGHWAGAAVGAYLGGQIYAAFARYDWVWIVSVALASLAGLLSLAIRETRGHPTALRSATT